MSLSGQISKAILGFLGLVLIGMAVYYGAHYFLDLFDVLDHQTAALTAVTVVTVLVSARIISGGIRWSRKQESKDRLRLKKLDLYSTLVNRWSTAVGEKEIPTSEGEFLEVQAKIAIIAGNSVIKEYAVLRDLSQQGNPDLAKIRLQLERTIKEMRKDLLENNLRLGDGEIMRVLQSARQ